MKNRPTNQQSSPEEPIPSRPPSRYLRLAKWGLAAASLGVALSTWAANPYLVRTFAENGQMVDEVLVPGSPPPPVLQPAVPVPEPQVAAGINSVANVPAFTWCYGCSATSAAMLMGFYDLHGYGNMYAGPANGGLCPLNNETWWGHTGYPSVTCGECPLAATHLGKDGRTTRGYVEDYWIDYNNCGSDPYQSGAWTEHTPDCTADFMGTSQAKYGNCDGSTTFYYYSDGSALLCDYTGGEPSVRDGAHGLKLYAQSRGFSVLASCSQYIYGYNGYAAGFTYAQFKAEIDAGRPVLIQLEGHTMLGYGYNDTGSTIYVHDTWDNNNHTMTWGGSYGGMQQMGVTTFQLAASSPPQILSQPVNTIARESRQATFTVGASGPSLQYFWKRNGAVISGANASSYSPTVQLTDSGTQFSCLVSNIYDLTNSQPATLTVLPLRPVIGSVTRANNTLSFVWSAVLSETFQVQYKTNLLQSGWLNLGGTFVATNNTLRVTESLTASRRFYRVVLQ